MNGLKQCSSGMKGVNGLRIMQFKNKSVNGLRNVVQE